MVACSLKLREESIITPRSLATVTGLISFPNNLTGGIDGRLLVNCGTPITRSLVLSGCMMIFCVIDEEYETLVSNEEHAEHQIVNGLDITAYRANVNEAYTGARDAFEASKTSSVSLPGSVSTPADPLTHPLDQSTTLPVQGPSQSGNNANPDQPVTGVVTVSSQTQSVTLSASSAQANKFPLGIGSIYPSGYSVAPAPRYPLVQSSTQPTLTHVYTGHLSSVLPQQAVIYAVPAQSNGGQANDQMGFYPISFASFSIPLAQQYWLHSHLFSSHQEDRFILDS